MSIKKIKVEADTSYAEMRIRELRHLNQLTEDEITQNKQKLRELYDFGSNIMSFVLTNVEQTAAVQAIQAAIQITQTQISIASMSVQLSAAIASGNWITAMSLSTSIAMQEYNLARGFILKQQAEQQRQYLESINRQREAYL